MSFSSIAVNLPDPYVIFPQPNGFPLGKVTHLTSANYFTAAAVLNASQLTAPIVANDSAGAAVALTLPSAVSLFNTLGGTTDSNGLVVGLGKVQAGDMFVVPLCNISITAGGVLSFVAGAVGVTLNGAASVAITTQGSLVIRWTAAAVAALPTYTATLVA